MAFLLVPAGYAAVSCAVAAGELITYTAIGAGVAYAMGAFDERGEPNHAPGTTLTDIRLEEIARERTEAEAAAQQQRDRDVAEAQAARERAETAAEAAEARAREQAALHEQEVQRARQEEAAKILAEIAEENRKKEEDRRDYPLPEFLKEHTGRNKVNIAVTGNSGVGKSSFINFIREIKKNKPGYAKVGARECTMEPICYPTTDGDNIWDLPGAGTFNFPQETYIKTMGIRYFDVVYLITAERFTQAELMLKKELDDFRVPYFCIRNKVDQAWESKISEENDSDVDDGYLSAHEEEYEVVSQKPKDKRKEELKLEMIDELRNYFSSASIGIDRVYLMSTKNEHRWTFDWKDLARDSYLAIENARLAKECPICFLPYKQYGGSAERKVVKCGHCFCEACLSFESASTTCPICRQDIQEALDVQ